MENKRKRLGLFSDNEEDGEEYWDMRIRPRKTKRVKYIEEYDEEKYEGDWEDDEQLGPSTENTCNNRPQENRLLPVTCGNKTGILDVEKMHWGEACIKCEGRWVLPTAFEDLGGKGHCKKWKTTIFYDKKPLQFWFEQGSLTTKGFKRRRSETAKETMSSNLTSESSSEESVMQSAEETEENVKAEDWLPGSEELAPWTQVDEEGDEEGVGEYGGEAVESVDRSEEEEDKMEDEAVAAAAEKDKGNSVFEEMAQLRSPAALQKKVKIVIKRLPESKHCQSNCKEQPVRDSCDPLKEDATNKEESEHAGSMAHDPSIILATRVDSSPMSDTTIIEGVGEEIGEEFMQSNEEKEDAQREIKTESGNCPTPLLAPATSAPDVKPEILNGSEDTGSSSICRVVNGDMLDIKEETNETGHYRCKYESTGAITSDAADFQGTKRETSLPKASDIAVVPPSAPCNGSDLDTMDLEQLRRKKLKMQLKVLMLQEEYYTRKIKRHKHCQCFRGASL